MYESEVIMVWCVCVAAITEHGLGRSVTVCLEPGPPNKLQTMPLLSVTKKSVLQSSATLPHQHSHFMSATLPHQHSHLCLQHCHINTPICVCNIATSALPFYVCNIATSTLPFNVCNIATSTLPFYVCNIATSTLPFYVCNIATSTLPLMSATLPHQHSH